MHPVNRVLSFFGLRLVRLHHEDVPGEPSPPVAFLREFAAGYEKCRANSLGFEVCQRLYYEPGLHPRNHIDFQCAFAAAQLRRFQPRRVLDVGSYRQFVVGVLSHFDVTTVDIRGREPDSVGETVVTGDASNLPLPSDSFDAVVSLWALEHIGLGRYGDAFGLENDARALSEMRRVLKPGGALILTTTVTSGKPTIWFNAHRVYSREMITNLCMGLKLASEAYFSCTLGRNCDASEVTGGPEWDVHASCWLKGA